MGTCASLRRKALSFSSHTSVVIVVDSAVALIILRDHVQISGASSGGNNGDPRVDYVSVEYMVRVRKQSATRASDWIALSCVSRKEMIKVGTYRVIKSLI